jgi:hypothetical protein
MGVQGLWTLVHERGKHEPLPLRGGSRALLIDSSAVEYAAIKAATDNNDASASSSDSSRFASLLLNHFRRGHYPEAAAALTRWLLAILHRGFKLVVFLDGATAEARTYKERRQGLAWLSGKILQGEKAVQRWGCRVTLGVIRWLRACMYHTSCHQLNVF